MSQSRSTWTSWILAIRPKTLTAALTPILVGTALASATRETIRVDLTLLALVSAMFIQIGTNLINDSLDFEKGADTGERMGPVRVTQSGLLGARQVWWGGLGCFLIAILLAIPLVFAGGWPIIAIGILSVLSGYAYTGGPFPLAYRGFGDFFVLLFFGWVAVSGIYYLNTGQFNWISIVAGSQVGLLATVLIAINNLRDHVTDRKAQKRTLAVRFGKAFARMEIALLCVFPFLLGIVWIQQGLKWASILPLFMAPLAVRLARRVQHAEPGPLYNQFLAQAAVLQLGFGGLLSVGLLWH